MLTNEQMIANRFARMAKVRRLQRKITETFAKGGIVQVATHLRYTNYTAKHAANFKFDRFSAYVARGKHFDCIDFCQIRFGLPKE
jgi:predicted SnoaL-like aldol condensation-catalyzing enzyme